MPTILSKVAIARCIHNLAPRFIDVYSIAEGRVKDLFRASHIRCNLRERGAKLKNDDIAKGIHIQDVFKKSRIPEFDQDFIKKVRKRASDMAANRPVLIIGQWRQGKSSLVNSLLSKAGSSDNVKVGRRERVTTTVNIHELPTDEPGCILLVDTPGWEPDKAYPIMEQFQDALSKKGISKDVLTDTIILVIAGQPQSLAELKNPKAFGTVKAAYKEARGKSVHCKLLPVITFADQIQPEDLQGDIEVVEERLKGIAQDGCRSTMSIIKPIAVSNTDGTNIDELFRNLCSIVKDGTDSVEFRLQWVPVLNKDLIANVKKFHAEYPDEETERRLFHLTVEAMARSYNLELDDLSVIFPKADWKYLSTLEVHLQSMFTPPMSFMDRAEDFGGSIRFTMECRMPGFDQGFKNVCQWYGVLRTMLH